MARCHRFTVGSSNRRYLLHSEVLNGSFKQSTHCWVRNVPQKVRTITLHSIWIILSLAVLLYCQYVFDGKPNSDSEEVLIILMFILSFPASFVAGAIAVGVAFSYEHLLHAPLQTSRLEMLFTWGLFFAAGYIQWFTLLPRAWSKWQMRKRAHSEGPELKRSDLA